MVCYGSSKLGAIWSSSIWDEVSESVLFAFFINLRFFLNRVLLSAKVNYVAFFSVGRSVGIGIIEIGFFKEVFGFLGR